MNDLCRIGDNNAQNKETQSPNSNRSYTEKIEYDMIDEEDSSLVENEELLQKKQKYSPSISSGEYEEILEDDFDDEYKSFDETPPPLPPRKSNNSSPSR